jgi:two-component system cell cycle sensor histidine kinase/response regulator CckA
MAARILIVEDDRIVVMEIRDTLESLGYGVAGVASSGLSAIEQAAEVGPDLVLMDVRLRGSMDGVEAASEIRRRFDIPVIYLTAYADDDTLRRAKVTEPYGYIIKPFEERELHTVIEMALYKHEMESRLRESQQRLATTLRSIGDAVIATDAGGEVVFMNSVAEALTGWKQEEALGRNIADVFKVIDETTRAAVENPVGKVLRRGTVVDLATHILIASDGREVLIDDTASLIKDEKERVDGAVVVFRDVTERKEAEEERERLQAQLFQAQKTEAIGVLAGGIAHDFTNLMTTIIGYSSLILSDLKEEDPLRGGIDFIKRAGERAASLTKQLLILSQKQMSQPRVLDLHALLTDMEEVIRRLAGDDIELVYALEPGLGYVQGDPDQLKQAIINLVVNAREAMPEGGRLVIEAETVTFGEEPYQDRPEARPGTFVCVSVRDSGVGMDEETLRSIFEPFFSTKEKGTGLGLSIVRNIVTQHDGWIEVSSVREQGSAFQVWLPAFVIDEAYQEILPIPLLEPQGQGEHILLVEDDEDVRAAVSEMLRAGGYEVHSVGSVQAAFEQFEEEHGDFDLVFTDVVLPDGDGLELVDHLLLQKPELPVLLTSGYTDQRSQWPIIRERGIPFLQKPFGLSDLLPVVSEALLTGQATKPADALTGF